MPLPPLPSRNLDWTNPAIAHREAHRATLELSSLAQAHRDKHDRDAVWIFLTIHDCISRKVVQQTSPSLLWLNTLFIERCIESYANLTISPPTILWKLAALAYKRMADSVVTVLTLALAHIHDDLSSALADLLPHMDLPKVHYDSAFKFIIECLDEHAYGGQAVSLKERFLRFLLKHFPHYSNDLIRDLREAVWISAYERIAAEMVRTDPGSRSGATEILAHAYWEAEGATAEDNWYRAVEFLDSASN